ATIDILSRQLQRDAGPMSWRKIEANRKVTEITAEMVASVEGAVSSAAGFRKTGS
ncbi:MAG: aminoglycoside phosphotransferase, partial [Mesorhizobium sp.]